MMSRDNRQTSTLNLHGVCKSFAGVSALRNVRLSATGGEALALLGANGAGKSTLMNVLGGLVQMDAGRIQIDQRDVQIRNAQAAKQNGIGFVHQELNVLPAMSVAENIFIDHLPTRRGLIDQDALRHQTETLLDLFDCTFGPDDLVESLSIGDQQIVEIAGALSLDPKIIIFDEPTSSLTSREKTRLFEVIKILKTRGVVVIYITHFLNEVFEIAERVAVLRNGENVGDGPIGQYEPIDLVTLMLGESFVTGRLREHSENAGEIILKLKGLRRAGALQGVDLELRRGEIVGLWGLLGSGRTELLRAMTGLDPLDDGQVLTLDGTGRLARRHPRQLHHAVGFVTEDRRGEGLVMAQNVKHNLALPSLAALCSKLGLIDGRRERDLAAHCVDRLNIKVSGMDQIVSTLSGGNQQKVVFGRWLATKPDIYLLDEPTRGLDVGAKGEILRLIAEVADLGAAVLIVCSEIEELMRICDRYLVIERGRIVAHLPGNSDQGALMKAVSGAPQAVETAVA